MLATRTRVLGVDHLDTLDAISELASTLTDQGKCEEAEVMQRQVLATITRIQHI